MLPQLDADPTLLLQRFRWVAVPGGISYSGYYEPAVRASRTRKPGYEHPIYKRPPDLSRVRARRGRYYDRRTIETRGVLAGKDLELAWAADPVDVFFLEIQGSGRLIFDDGTQAFVNYDGQNGHKYKSSGRIMREKGLLKRGDIFEQREWFKNNPDRVWEILLENPSYAVQRVLKDKADSGDMDAFEILVLRGDESYRMKLWNMFFDEATRTPAICKMLENTITSGQINLLATNYKLDDPELSKEITKIIIRKMMHYKKSPSYMAMAVKTALDGNLKPDDPNYKFIVEKLRIKDKM